MPGWATAQSWHGRCRQRLNEPRGPEVGGPGRRGWEIPVARRATVGRPDWQGTQAVLLDQQSSVAPETHQAFQAFGWQSETREGRRSGLAQAQPDAPACDVVIANLFLHHFPDAQLAGLLRAKRRAHARLFIAVEPRRSPRSLPLQPVALAHRLQRVTRHDAVVSVRAGFAGRELSAALAGGRQLVTVRSTRPGGSVICSLRSGRE